MPENTPPTEPTSDQKLNQTLQEFEVAKANLAEQTKRAAGLSHLASYGEWPSECPEHLKADVRRRQAAGLTFNQAVEAAINQELNDKRGSK